MQGRGIYLLTSEHVEAIQRLASDPALAETTRLPHPYPPGAAQSFVESRIKLREEGTSWCFAIQDGNVFVGLVGLEGIEQDVGGELGFWIGREYWGKGHATFAVKMMLEFAFRNLSLCKICAAALESNAASRRVLEKNGFQLIGTEHHNDPFLKRPNEKVAKYEITRPSWATFVNGLALLKVHPALQRILNKELAAGNEVLETAGGWPERDSLFVRLRYPFRTKPSLPAGIQYTELNDPHLWNADFSSHSPRHILAC